METTTCKPSQKYVESFIATFLPQSRGEKLYRAGLNVITNTVSSVLQCKFQYQVDKADVFSVFKTLRYDAYPEKSCYSSIDASMPLDEHHTSGIYYNIENSKIDELRFLTRILLANKPVRSILRIDELNLQLDLFDRLYRLKYDVSLKNYKTDLLFK